MCACVPSLIKEIDQQNKRVEFSRIPSKAVAFIDVVVFVIIDVVHFNRNIIPQILVPIIWMMHIYSKIK